MLIAKNIAMGITYDVVPMVANPKNKATTAQSAALITPANLSITSTDADFPTDITALFAMSKLLKISPPTLVGRTLLKNDPIKNDDDR